MYYKSYRGPCARESGGSGVVLLDVGWVGGTGVGEVEFVVVVVVDTTVIAGLLFEYFTGTGRRT